MRHQKRSHASERKRMIEPASTIVADKTTEKGKDKNMGSKPNPSPTIVATTKHSQKNQLHTRCFQSKQPKKQTEKPNCRDKATPNCPDYTTTVNPHNRSKIG